MLAWLSMDVLQGQLGDMDLLLLLERHRPVLLNDLSTLIACV